MILGEVIKGGASRAPIAGPEQQTASFFERIMPPPGAGSYISVHSVYRKPDGKISYPGKGFDSVESAAAHIHKWNWIAQKNGQPYESYFHCIGALSRATPKNDKSGKPYLSTHREQANVASVKALFIDLDVKEKAFATQGDALAAIMDIVKAGELPAPTMVVNSGNGLHLYWTLNRAMAPAAWVPYAEGLGRFLQSKGIFLDPLYANYACLLRPPGSWNVKDKANPKQVRIVGRVLAHDYDPSIFNPLLPYRNVAAMPAKSPARPAAMSQPPTGQGSLTAAVANGPGAAQQAGGDSNIVALLPRLPAIAPSGELSAGVSEALAQPVSMSVVVERCAVLKDVLARGGNGDSEPLWRASLQAASFDPDGREWAHKLSSGDPRYVPADTDAKFDSVVQQRQQSGGRIGWPLCSTYAKHSNACISCPFNGRIKSPFSIAADDSDLPKGYSRKDGVIWKDHAVEVKNDDGSKEMIPAVAFPYGVRDAHLEVGIDGLTLNTELIMPHDPPRRMRVSAAAISTWRDKVHAVFGLHGIALAKSVNHLAQEFFVAFIHHLQAAKATSQRRDAVGWTKTRDGIDAFAFNGKCWTATGGFEITAGIDPVLESRYSQTGSFGPWKAAADFVTGMGRIDLQAILAGAFAGPLVRYTGQSGLLLSAYSPKSGVQKSTAMKVAQSVWGNPVTAMNRVDDTYNSVANKLGAIRHLPVLWDELQTDQYDLFSRLVFTLMQGSEKGRLTSDVAQRVGGTWATMLVSAGNFSVQDMMQRGAKNTTAGLNRVFEILVEPPPGHAIISVSQASAIVAETHTNFGHAGERYAQALIRRESTLKPLFLKIADDIEKMTKATAEERFWVFTAATLFLGATLARAEGLVDFDLPALRRFLIDNVKGQRVAKTAASVDVTSPDYAANILARYIQHCRRRNAYLETNLLTAPRAAGGLGLIEVKLPEEVRRQLRAPVFHLARDVGVARFIRQEFQAWLAEEGVPQRAVLDALVQHGGMVSTRSSWAAGTEWNLAKVPCYEIALTGGTNPTDAVGNFFGFGLKTGQAGGTP